MSCDECGAVGGLHQRGCPADRSTVGPAIGRRKQTRTQADRDRLRLHQRIVFAQGGMVCQRCRRFRNLDAHHRMTEQTGRSRRLPWVVIDALDNLVPLCRECHDWVHANPEDAIEAGFLER